MDHTNFQVYDYLMTLLVAISFRLLCLLSIMVPICPVTNILWQHRTFCRNINSLNQGCNQLTFKAGNNDCNLFYLTTVNFLAHSKCFLKFCGRAIARLPPPPGYGPDLNRFMLKLLFRYVDWHQTAVESLLEQQFFRCFLINGVSCETAP